MIAMTDIMHKITRMTDMHATRMTDMHAVTTNNARYDNCSSD